MSPLLLLWLRRCNAKLAFPALVAVAVVFVLGRTGWDWEWHRAMDWAAGSTILLGPLTAGLVAFDFWRLMPAGLSSVMAGAARGRVAVLGPVVSTWAYAVIACAVGLGLAAVRTVQHGADGSPSWWFAVQAPVALFAAASLGALVGSLLANVAAAPVAAFAAYLVPVAGGLLGIPDLLVAGGATGSLIGVVPDVGVMLMTIVVDLLVAVSCLALVMMRVSVRSRVSAISTGAAVATLLASTSLLVALEPAQNGFRPSAVDKVCAGGSIVVCGPRGGRAIYVIAQQDITRAWSSLGDLGDPPPAGYEYAVGVTPPARDAGLLYVTTESIAGNELDPWDLAATIATPTACRAFYADVPPAELLEGQRRLTEWVVARLAGEEDSGPTQLAAAQDTYAALTSCRPEEVPDWDAMP